MYIFCITTMSHIHIIAAIKAKRAATKEYTESIESLFINELSRFIDENDEAIANAITTVRPKKICKKILSPGRFSTITFFEN